MECGRNDGGLFLRLGQKDTVTCPALPPTLDHWLRQTAAVT